MNNTNNSQILDSKSSQDCLSADLNTEAENMNIGRSSAHPQPAIIISGLKKQYRLGSIGGRTLQEDLQSWWARKHGREDPNVRIGVRQELIGKKFMALDGIDLQIMQGEAVGIIGANGAGKSTLLKILSRITAPTEGEIDIYGRITSMLEVGTGFHREMTGRENVYMNGAILGMTKAEIDSQIDRIIEFSEIGEFIDTPVKRYSSGMFVKLAFAVAAHLKSEIMIMDEVLAVGDMAFQHKCIDKMREAAQVEGRTVLYVSHNMNTIRRLCNRCIVLENGRVIYDGEVEHAIAVYMDRAVGENQVDIDLTKLPHNTIPDAGELCMQHLALPGKVTAVYEPGEPLKLKLSVQVRKPVKDIQLRLTFRTDTDAGLGTSWSEPMDFSHVEAGKCCTATCTMDMNMIAKGMFYVSIGLYKKDEIGYNLTVDHITRAFKIEVTGAPNWYTSAYGNVALPAVKCEVS